MICKKCQKEFTEKYSKHSNGDFCSYLCARQYSRSQSKNNPTKIVHCITCQTKIEVDKRASDKQCKCDNCKKKKKKCGWCGEYTCLRKDICKKSKIINNLIKYFGFNISTIGTLNFYKEYDKIVIFIENEYWVNELSTLQLEEMFGTKSLNMFTFLKRIGIKTRSLSDSIKNAIKHKRFILPKCNYYKNGWHTTWNNKQVFYRSSYELDYCKELDKLKTDYEVEFLRVVYWDSISQESRIAIPDFYLPETNEIVEIKSNYTYIEQNMKDKFKAYIELGYKVKLILEHENIIFQ